MLRALYDFEAPYEGTLTFREKDLFVLLPRSDADPNWVHVVDGRGTHGYAPSNYLAPADCDLVQVGHVVVLFHCLDRVAVGQVAAVMNRGRGRGPMVPGPWPQPH